MKTTPTITANFMFLLLGLKARGDFRDLRYVEICRSTIAYNYKTDCASHENCFPLFGDKHLKITFLVANSDSRECWCQKNKATDQYIWLHCTK